MLSEQQMVYIPIFRKSGVIMKDNKSKIFLTAAFILFVVLLVLGYWICLRKGVDIGDDYFYKVNNEVYKADDNNYLEFQEREGAEEAAIVLNGEKQTAQLVWDGSDVKITYSDGTVINGKWGGDGLSDEEGVPIMYSEAYMDDYVGAGSYEESAEVRKAVLGEALCRISRDAVKVRGSIWLMLFGMVLYISGILIIRNPEASFFFLNRWRYRDAELSEAGKAVEQIGGIAVMIVGAVFLSGIFLL